MEKNVKYVSELIKRSYDYLDEIGILKDVDDIKKQMVFQMLKNLALDTVNEVSNAIGDFRSELKQVTLTPNPDKL